MELIVTMIVVLIALAVVWRLFIYMTEIRKDKILDDYIARKHKRKRRFKKPGSANQVSVASK